jgi:nitrogen fixation/metabolism regulation signal transduction histidine kinase
MDRLKISFRMKIQYAIIFIILASFVVIGSLIISNTNRQYESYHQSRLMRKSKQILSGLQYLKNNAGEPFDWQAFLNNPNLKDDLINLSEIHSIDINLFDPAGKLTATSQPGVYELGLIESVIDPGAMNMIERKYQSQFINSASIGRLNYLSAYLPVLDENNSIRAILNIPYYAKEKNLKEEISNFLVYFINIYVLLFVLAGLLGLLLTNSITRPIAVLGTKMREIQLGRPNQPIAWKNRDEIGQLIEQYNRMLEALEKNAKLLAQSERESAWRDMAKQVAHEIKNPLTPMKLSIQQLQRSFSDNDNENITQINRVAKTLIEQIENLSNIASEFSAFAKMPPAQMEKLNINELLKSVIELFKNEPVNIKSRIPDEPFYIHADKGQIIRVLNNVIKNACQSIPDENEGIIKVALEGKGDMILISVDDNGAGISDELADKVFVPNFTTKSAGMGIGLAMSKKIIEMAGGRIWFESKTIEGTVFFIELPVDH